MGKQLRDLLEQNSYKKKIKTPSSMTIGNKPKRRNIESSLTDSGIPLPKTDLEFELNDKKGNIHVISYRAAEDEYYYITQNLVK